MTTARLCFSKKSQGCPHFKKKINWWRFEMSAFIFSAFKKRKINIPRRHIPVWVVLSMLVLIISNGLMVKFINSCSCLIVQRFVANLGFFLAFCISWIAIWRLVSFVWKFIMPCFKQSVKKNLVCNHQFNNINKQTAKL